MTNTATLTVRATTEKEQATIFKSYRTREACANAIVKMDRTNKVYQFAIANCWKQLKDFFQTEDCTLDDMCKQFGVSKSTISEQIKVINTIDPVYYGVYTMTQLVEICRLKNVDFTTYDFTENFPNTLTAKEIRTLVKKMNNAVSEQDEATEQDGATEQDEATEQGEGTERAEETYLTIDNAIHALKLAKEAGKTPTKITIIFE